MCAWITSVLSSNSRRLKFKRTASLCVSVRGCTTVCLKWGQWEVEVAEERRGGVDAGHGRQRMTAGACRCRQWRRSLSFKIDGFGSEEAAEMVRRHYIASRCEWLFIFTVEEEEDQLLARGAGHRRRHQQPLYETIPEE